MLALCSQTYSQLDLHGSYMIITPQSLLYLTDGENRTFTPNSGILSQYWLIYPYCDNYIIQNAQTQQFVSCPLTAGAPCVSASKPQELYLPYQHSEGDIFVFAENSFGLLLHHTAKNQLTLGVRTRMLRRSYSILFQYGFVSSRILCRIISILTSLKEECQNLLFNSDRNNHGLYCVCIKQDSKSEMALVNLRSNDLAFWLIWRALHT